MHPNIPVYKDLVLVGGGHAHVQVLKRFGMKPIPGLRVTLITPDVQTPYSGMLPGYVSGFYTYDDCHIDLVRLARFANARLIHAQARGVDLSSQEIHLVDRPSLQYDVLSLNIGIAPSTQDIPGASQYTVPVKPISTFAARFQHMLQDANASSNSSNKTCSGSRAVSDGNGNGSCDGRESTNIAKSKGSLSTPNVYRVAIVGGGASGVELACAVQYRLTQERMSTCGLTEEIASKSIKISLISKGKILSGVAPYARKAFLPLLKERNIEVYEVNSTSGTADEKNNEFGDSTKNAGGGGGGSALNGVVSVEQNMLHLSDGTSIPFDTCMWSTQAGAAGWLASGGLPTDDRGFLRVNEFLQAEGGPENVFGAGDCTTNVANPRPKAGVYAVRAGMPLAENIAAYVQDKPLRPWHPQSSHLNLISAGNKYAVAVKGNWLGAQGAALWRLKDWIDRKFMAKFGSELDFDEERMNKMMQQMARKAAAGRAGSASIGLEAAALAAASKMRCGGCGAKVGASTLSRVLEKLRLDENKSNENTNKDYKQHANNTNIVVGLNSPDDAAVLEPPPPGHVTIHTVDFFKSIIDDPYIFGSIAANHALSDCYAMGASPTAALAIAVLPFSSSKITEGDLYQLMAGANKVLRDAGCALAGGHSCEGAELSLGFSIYGTAPRNFLLSKTGLQPGHVLILTKPLGTGVIFAASMRGLAQGRWISGAIASMLESNEVASEVLREYDCTACTDVTGFGLLGHLAEMARASEVAVEVDVASVPMLQGAAECVAAGVVSTLHSENAKISSVVSSSEDNFRKLPAWTVLIDPQTSGGLLGSVPAERAEACVAELRRRGCMAAAVVGKVVSSKASDVSSASGNGELRAEASGSNDDPTAPLLLDEDSIERALMSRLSNPPASYPQWPVQYLMGCYARAADEARSISLLKEAADQQRLLDTLTLARQLAVSYTGLILTVEMFPQPPNAQTRGDLQLLDSIFATYTMSSSSGGLGFIGTSSSASPPLIPDAVTAETQVVPMPAGFLEDLATRFAEEGFSDMLQTIVPTLMKKLSTMSVLGDFSALLGVLERLCTSKPVASALVKLPGWLPRAESDGRAIEFQTLLGTAFGISAIPDLTGHPLKPSVRLPDVVATYFPQPDSLRQAEVRSSIASIHAALGQLHSQLHRIMMALLRNSETRDNALSWLAFAIRSNQERAKMRPDVKKSATDGFMVNIVAVMLKMCEPFIDPTIGKAWSKLNSRYASDPMARGRCFDDDTRLAATSEAVSTWASDGGGGAENSSGDGSYHFICEIFFLTGMALRLGFSKALETCTSLVRTAQHYAEDAEGAPGPQAMTLRAASQRFKGIAIAMETCFKQDSLINDVIAYYRLLSAYLLRLACPSAAAGGPPCLPLPEPAPMEFASLPEFYVEDLCVALTWVARGRPDLVSAQRMDEYMLFFTVFMGSPSYVKNPYLRGKMVEALTAYMPPSEDEGRDSWRPRVGGGRGADEVATLFEVHPLVIGNMVRALISLFVDIERTDRANAFYEKFNMRYHIGEIMGYLWKLPQHRGAWREVALSDPKLYIRFVNFILADSQHLLQEALDTLPAVQETERLQDDRAAWDALGQNERAERLQALESHRNHLRSDFALAEIYLKTMNFTSEDPTVASRFFDVQVRDRQARILNFFLRYLTLPAERRRLKLKDPERYGWRPKELIASLASVHVNLYRSDKQAWCDAVAADTDYYGPNPDIFEELISVLRALGLASSDFISDLEALAAGAAAAVANAVAEEDAFEDIPEEYEDQLLGGIMWDPVKLPSGQIVNRATILQQLLTDQRDPFNRAPMTEEDLVECPELKSEVAAWVADQRAKRKAAAGGGGGGGGDGAEPMET